MIFISLFFKGLVIGFTVAAPVGPLGVLCIRRTLSFGRTSGFLTGLGVATADALYGCIAGFGLTLITSFLIGYKNYIGLVGGLFLCYLGWRTIRPKKAAVQEMPDPKGLVTTYLSTFFLTLTNPMTILSFVAIFAGLGAVSSTDFLAPVFLVSGVFCGSALWWLLLSTGIDLLKSKAANINLGIINTVSGVIIFLFGLNAILKSVL